MSLSELIETLATAMNFPLFESSEFSDRVAYLYDVRNLITHNYGLVDQHFLDRHPACEINLGATFPLRVEFIKATFEDLIKAPATFRPARRRDSAFSTKPPFKGKLNGGKSR
jgi:hypothetical protein